MKPDEDVLATWTGVAPYWEKHAETIREMFAPITEALIEESHIEPGDSVLDVATGPGEPALTIARVVGSAGSVDGVDLVAEMIAAATRTAARRNLTNSRFQVASADLLPFADAGFDAVVSRFGIMFFPSPAGAVREMLRVMKMGRTLAFAVWSAAETNPFHCVFARVVDRYVPPESVAPDAPDPFRFAAPGKLLSVLHEAGAARASERVFQFQINVPLSVEDFWALRLEMSEKIRKKLAPLSAADQSAIQHEVIQDLRSFSAAQGLSLPAEVLIVSGTKP